MNKTLKMIALSVVFATAGNAKDTGLNKLEMQKVFSSSDVKTMKLDVKEQSSTQGESWFSNIVLRDLLSRPFVYPGFNWLDK